VVRVVGGDLLPLRRARGYAPIPVAVAQAHRTVLAVGGELKNTFCVARGGHAWVSQHLGDMDNLDTLEAFEAGVDRFSRLYGIDPEMVAVDAHPGYRTGAWARRRYPPERLVQVQHHHAHVAAVMAEASLDPAKPVIGVSFDGTGYGDDGTIWGGEVLLADASRYQRAAHLAPVLLPGGDAAIRHPARVALSYLHAAGLAWDGDLPPVQALFDTERRLLAQQFERQVACVPSSSMGRLFDAVASLLGLRHTVSFEAQAAIDLELAAAAAGAPAGYRFTRHGPVVGHGELWRALVADLRCGVAVADIAAGFHEAVVALVVDLAGGLRAEHGVATVVLSGGVFQNALLAEACLARLRTAGFDVFTHRLVPPNDGGLSLGQAFIAAHSSLDRATGTDEEV
jgi:hydrogenase maturation protein HypF